MHNGMPYDPIERIDSITADFVRLTNYYIIIIIIICFLAGKPKKL